ncbi:MAG: YihA family ribosome biogenesis GTP-binding protein [Clostridia bacterium]|nr:YihA family ribosome biogenesis GTP-binding protein [Clostridia bacterium]
MKLNTNKVELMISAVRKNQYPNTVLPEIALVGRSNVGKSSLINKVLNRRNFARVSATPGKTATINFYNIDDGLIFVDLPGYGYAAKAHDEIKKWGDMIGEYLNNRPQLMQVILLVDSRHKPTKDDVMMMEWIRSKCEYAVVFATKCDKISKTQLSNNLELIIETLDLQDGDILIPFSTKNPECADDFWDYVYGCVLDDEEEE